jgi:hypothetical protein
MSSSEVLPSKFLAHRVRRVILILSVVYINDMTLYCYFYVNRLNSELHFQRHVYKQAVFCLNSLICKKLLNMLNVYSVVKFPCFVMYPA